MLATNRVSRKVMAFSILCIMVVGALLSAPAAEGRSQTAKPKLTNLVEKVSLKKAMRRANRLCPEQTYFRYVGGHADKFGGAADPSYPSANLAALTNTQALRIDYDTPMTDDWFGDSFNLQNGRRVCHALLRVTFQKNGGTNDTLVVGHVSSGVFASPRAAQVNYPGAPGTTAVTYLWAFDATGIAELSNITSASTPEDAVLDFYVEDDTAVDNIRLWVWYHP